MTRVHSKEKTAARDLSLFIASNRFFDLASVETDVIKT